MSIEIKVVNYKRFTIICNVKNCSMRFGTTAIDLTEARKKARKKGWQMYTYGYDLCSHHVLSPRFHAKPTE